MLNGKNRTTNLHEAVEQLGVLKYPLKDVFTMLAYGSTLHAFERQGLATTQSTDFQYSGWVNYVLSENAIIKAGKRTMEWAAYLRDNDYVKRTEDGELIPTDKGLELQHNVQKFERFRKLWLENKGKISIQIQEVPEKGLERRTSRMSDLYVMSGTTIPIDTNLLDQLRIQKIIEDTDFTRRLETYKNPEPKRNKI